MLKNLTNELQVMYRKPNSVTTMSVRGLELAGHLVRIVMGKKKVKVTLVQALRFCTGRTAHRGSRGIALPFHDHGTRRG